jgi:molybdopterin converting factor subunit 1
MMQVTVSLFATLRQIAGWKERQVTVSEGTTLGDLMQMLTEQHPELKLTERTLYAAVNQEYAQKDTPLTDGDEVAIFPPVSGGRVVHRWVLGY